MKQEASPIKEWLEKEVKMTDRSLDELFEEALRAADLRRRETPRLISAASKVAQAICNLARETGLEGFWAYRRDPYDGDIEATIERIGGTEDNAELRVRACGKVYYIAADNQAEDVRLDSMPYRLWAEVVPLFPVLVEALAKRAKELAEEIRQAAGLAEGLAIMIEEKAEEVIEKGHEVPLKR
ncbi:MAG: hypothetical protein ABC596_05870 [Candidatus Methanosuratincola petrocarbonis]